MPAEEVLPVAAAEEEGRAKSPGLRMGVLPSAKRVQSSTHTLSNFPSAAPYALQIAKAQAGLPVRGTMSILSSMCDGSFPLEGQWAASCALS